MSDRGPAGGSILEDLKKDGYRPPSKLGQALPWLLAAGILVWVFRSIRFEDFLLRLLEARLGLIVIAVLLFAFLFTLADALSAGLSYRWFVAPRMPVRDIAAARLGAFLLHVFYTPLFTAANIAYLKRRLGAPILHTLSANGFTVVHDFFAINLVLTAAFAVNLQTRAAPEIGGPWFLLSAAIWAVGLGYALYWFTPVKDLGFLKPVTMTAIFMACRLGRVRHSLLMIGLRLAVALLGVAAHGVALHGFGIAVPLPMLLTAAPLLIAVSFLPVSSAGFGGPQLVALILLPYAGGDRALVTAYSVAFSALFTAGRSVIGAAFLPSYLKGLRGPASSAPAPQGKTG